MRFPFPPSGQAPALKSQSTSDVQARELHEGGVSVAGGLERTAAPFAEDSEISQFAQTQIAVVVEELVAAETATPPPLAGEAPNHSGPQSQPESENPKREDEEAPIRIAPLPRPRNQRKVIAFPRHLMATPEAAYRLADPVAPECPRILEVPEELEAVSGTPFLDGLTFEGKTPSQPGIPEPVELPVRPVSLAQRTYAVAVDAVLVLAASAVFAGVAYRFMAGMLMGKSLLAAAAVVPMLLWFVYQYLLLVYGGTTPGMRASKVRLLTFAGAAPKMRQRRNRVMGLWLSTASLAMGLLWAFVDVDGLCWHDRMSQTYLTSL